MGRSTCACPGWNEERWSALRQPGQDLRRSYSICAGPDDGELRVAVKQVDRGVFSSWVNASLKPGDAIEVMTPTGRFGANGTSAGCVIL